MSEENLTVQKLKQRFDNTILDVATFRDDTTVTVRREDILAVNRFLRDEVELRYNYLVDLCGVDNLGSEPRFMLVYHLYSYRRNERIRIKAGVPEEDCTIASMTPLWKGANWLEREAYDMFGIKFEGHPNLVRILNTDDFDGHPLRKDFPVKGKRALEGSEE